MIINSNQSVRIAVILHTFLLAARKYDLLYSQIMKNLKASYN